MTSQRLCDDRLSWRQRCLCVAGVMTALVIAALLAIYLLVLNNRDDDPDRNDPLPLRASTSVWTPRCPTSPAEEEKFDCYPEDPQVSEERCSARGCCWTDDDDIGPKCFFPSNYGYRTSGQAGYSSNRMDIPLVRLPTPSRYGDDITHAQVRLEMQTPYRLRLKIFDPKNSRYETSKPHIPEDPDPSLLPLKEGTPVLYSVSHSASPDPFSIQVRREKTKTIIFDTSVGGLTLSHQFLQLSTRLPSNHVYGLGEQRHSQFQHDLNWRTWGMFSQGASLQDSLSGVHPVYMCVENDGSAHGVLLLNSNALEVHLQPTPALTFRTIGGVLDFYIFLGPTPEDVVKQYTEAVGRPAMPPYWALGFHFGREGYLNTGQVRQDLEDLRRKDIPVDVLHVGTDYAKDHATFYVDKGRFGDLPLLALELSLQGQRYVLAIDPAVSTEQPVSRYPPYYIGLNLGVFVNGTWSKRPLVVQSKSGFAVYPDFGGTSTGPWWTEALWELHRKLQYDGIVMVGNEPTTEATASCKGDNLNRPPYFPRVAGKELFSHTLCMDATHFAEDRRLRHYDVHNVYGLSMTIATDQAASLIYGPKRSFLMSSSTYPGSGKYAGHWISFGGSEWTHLASTVPAVLEFGLFGIPLVGAGICGDVSEELCLRSIQLGAFFPACLLYNGQGLVGFSEEFIATVHHTLHRRYELLPFLYTLFHSSHTSGSTVVRPLHHEFPADNATYSIQHQFLWGPSLMVTPVLGKGETSVRAYFPAGGWFDYYTGKEVESSGHWEELTAPLHSSHKPMNLHIRGGHIIPTQRPANTTDRSRRNPMELRVALDSRQTADGHLFWDDGETRGSHLLGAYILVTFHASKNKLEVTGHFGNKETADFHQPSIQHIRVMGITRQPTAITIDESYMLTERQYHWESRHKVLHMKNIIVPLDRTTHIEWSL